MVDLYQDAEVSKPVVQEVSSSAVQVLEVKQYAILQVVAWHRWRSCTKTPRQVLIIQGPVWISLC